MLFLFIYILHLNFCTISFKRTQDLHYPRILELQHPSPACYSCKNYINVLFKIGILHAKFRSVPCNRMQDLTITRILGKTEWQRPLLRYIHLQCIITISNIFCRQIFVWIHLLENKISLPQEFLKKYGCSSTCWAIFTKSW